MSAPAVSFRPAKPEDTKESPVTRVTRTTRTRRPPAKIRLEDIHAVEMDEDILPYVTPGRSRRSPAQLSFDKQAAEVLHEWREAGRPTAFLKSPLRSFTIVSEKAEPSRFLIRKAAEFVGGDYCRARFGKYNVNVADLPAYIRERKDIQAGLARGEELIVWTVWLTDQKDLVSMGSSLRSQSDLRELFT